MHYLHVKPTRFWRVKAGVDSEVDLGAFESWGGNDSNEVIVLVPWVQKITWKRNTPDTGGVKALFAGAGLVAEEIKGPNAVKPRRGRCHSVKCVIPLVRAVNESQNS